MRNSCSVYQHKQATQVLKTSSAKMVESARARIEEIETFEAAHLKESFSTWDKKGGAVEFPEKKS